jgi:hypothetical protein
MKRLAQYLLNLSCAIILVLPLSGCGSGGGGEEAPSPVSPSPQTIVSGMVQAPAGQIAFLKEKNFLDFFVAEAYAALTGLANVPDNTIVQLARLDANASNFSVITTTTTSGGRYSFNLTAFGLQPANDLIVRVADPGGKEMRAFVVGTVTDISPVSEAAYQLAVQSLNGRSLDNLTLQEASDISGAVGLIGTLQNLGTATSIDQAVELVKTAVRNNAPVSGFLTAAATTGQTEEGAGDIGTFFPFEQGNIWRYKGTGRVSGAAVEYENTVTVSEQVSVPGHAVSGTIFSHTNAGGQGRAENYYEVKELSGIMSYGTDDPRNNDTGQLVPFRTVHFPLTIGATILLGERNNVDWGEDGDGLKETVSYKFSQTVLGMESITVPAGTFPNSLRMELKTVLLVSFTRGGSGTITQTNTTWLVPGVGRVKEIIEGQINDEPFIVSVTEQLLGYVVNGQGSGLRVEITPTSVSLSEGETIQLRATAFDQNNNPIPGIPFVWQSNNPSVVSVSQTGLVTTLQMGTTSISVFGGSNLVPVTVSNVRILSIATNDLSYDKASGKLYASTPGNQGRIITIDPATGVRGTSVVVGDDPNKIAIFDNGQFLYVSLDNESAIRRLSLPSLTSNLTIALGSPPPAIPQEYLCGKDIDVLPGNARGIVVTRAKHLASGSCNLNEAYEAVVFQDGTELPNKFGGQGPAFAHLVEFGDSSSHVFALGTFSSGSLSRISVTPSGLSFVDFSLLANWPGRDFKYNNGRIYTASGDVLDSSTYNVVGSFSQNGNPSGGGSSVTVDPVSRKVFFVTGGPNDSTASIQAYDMTSLVFLGSVDIPNLGIPTVPQFTRYTSLIRWGANGLAFRTSSNEVIIIRSPLVWP